VPLVSAVDTHQTHPGPRFVTSAGKPAALSPVTCDYWGVNAAVRCGHRGSRGRTGWQKDVSIDRILTPGAPMALAALEAVAEANGCARAWPTSLWPGRADPP